jgi:hypothetical protein
MSGKHAFSLWNLRGLLRCSDDAEHVRRLLSMAAILDGTSHNEATIIGVITLQIVREWMI